MFVDPFVPHTARSPSLFPPPLPPFPLRCVQIMKEIHDHKIRVYEFPETDDEEEMKMVKRIKVRMFF